MWTAAAIGGSVIVAMLLVYWGFSRARRREVNEAKEEGREEARRDTMQKDTEVIEKQRDEAVNRPDPHHPDDVLGRL